MMISRFVWWWQWRKSRNIFIVWDGSCPFLKVRQDRYIDPRDNVPDGWFLTDVLFR